MNQICIAKKVSHNNVEFLDFALDNNDNLLVFETFKEASEFLKKEVGTGEQLLDFIITTTEAQKNNPRMQEILNKDGMKFTSQPATPVQSKKEEVEFLFLLDCEDFDIENNNLIVDKRGNRKLAPVIAFVDVANPTVPVQITHYTLKTLMVDRASNHA
jgi:hypothetical protein